MSWLLLTTPIFTFPYTSSFHQTQPSVQNFSFFLFNRFTTTVSYTLLDCLMFKACISLMAYWNFQQRNGRRKKCFLFQTECFLNGVINNSEINDYICEYKRFFNKQTASTYNGNIQVLNIIHVVKYLIAIWRKCIVYSLHLHAIPERQTWVYHTAYTFLFPYFMGL